MYQVSIPPNSESRINSDHIFPALGNTVTSSSDEAAGTVEVLCRATDAQTVEWSVSGLSQTFQQAADPDTVSNSASEAIVLHQGLTLSSTIEASSAGPGLNNIESRLVFDSSFPLSGSFLCSCTARTMFSSAGRGTSVQISASTPTSRSARNLDRNPPTNVLYFFQAPQQLQIVNQPPCCLLTQIQPHQVREYFCLP